MFWMVETVLDIMLFALANCSICYLTMNGHIMATDYKYMIFNYLHFGLTSVLLVGINSAFGLYRSVWYFAGSDEIVKSFLGAIWVHAECSYKVAVFLCAVNYLAFVYLACDMLKNSRRYLNTNADINSV